VSTSRPPGRAEQVDVLIIGCGVLGCAVAARLSQTTASVCLIEAAADVCEGASKGNAGNVISVYGEPGTEETAFLNASNPLFDDLCARLGVPFRRIGAVMVATTAEEEERLGVLLEQIRACGVRAAALTAAQVRVAEPLVTEKCRAGIELPDEAIVDPMCLTVTETCLVAPRKRKQSMSIKFKAEREKVIIYSRKLQAERLVYSTAGHISLRIPDAPNLLACTPTGTQYDLLEPEDVAIVTLDGEQVDGRLAPTSEVAMHTLICKNRPDVGSIVHTHDKAVMTFANLGWTLLPILTGLVEATGGAVYCSPYPQPETDQMYNYTKAALADRGAMFLRYHGLLAIGADLERAFHTCRRGRGRLRGVPGRTSARRGRRAARRAGRLDRLLLAGAVR
jgi:ribulose-5-phosphate 4-epimerase/fuculose-1-phosphate aldolase